VIGAQINWRAHVTGKGSYSIVARELLLALWRQDVDVVVERVHPSTRARSTTTSTASPALEEAMRRAARPAAEQVHVRSMSRPNERESELSHGGSGHVHLPIVDAATNVAMLAVDGTLPDPHAQYRPDQSWDLLIVPSTHSARALLNGGTEPHRVAVVPHGVDPVVFRPGLKPLPLETSKRFRFLVNTTPWLDRKNVEAAFRAYHATFSATDDVCLVIHSPRKLAATVGGAGMRHFRVDGAIRELSERIRAEMGGTAAVLYLLEDLEVDDVARLNAACHCLVHPHRAEAFGLTIIEAMACGLCTITTGWSGNMDYCSPETNILLPYRLVWAMHRSPLEWAEPDLQRIQWAEPSMDCLRSRLRWVVDNPDRAAQIGRRAAAAARTWWTWERMARLLVSTIEDRLQRPIRRRHAPGRTVYAPR
jgi:glycosyltransferase involved in cell wall biosynthesis